MRCATVAVATALLICSAAQADITSELRARFRFDGNIADSLGHAAAVNGSIGTASGIVGGAAVFNGTNSWILVSHGGDLTFDLDTDPYTIGAWVLANGTPNSQTIIQDRHGDNVAVACHLGFDIPSNLLSNNSWYGFPTGTTFEVGTSAAQIIGAWHHIVTTFDGNSKRLYIDGVQVGPTVQRPNQAFTPNNTGGVTIGAYYSSNGAITRYFSGRLDDLRIYGRSLSAADVAELYQYREPPPSCNDALVDGFETGQVGQAPMNWPVRLPGGGTIVSASRAAQGVQSIRQRALAFSAAEVASSEMFSIREGIATLEASIMLSSESTNTGSDCNDVAVTYQGRHGVMSIGFGRPGGTSALPLVIAGTNIPVVRDRWYHLKGVANYTQGVVDWYVDDVKILSCVPLGSGQTAEDRADRVELHIGCIDNGQSVAYFDAVSFVPMDPVNFPPQPMCDGDRNGLDSQDFFDFLDCFFSSMP